MTDRIRIYTTSWCGDCHRGKWFLNARQLPCEEIDIEAHPEAADFVMRANNGKRKAPTFEVRGRTFHCSPFDAEKLSPELGL